MQLHNRLSSLFQKESDRLLKSFLNENPDLLKKYIDSGVTVVSAVLGPVNLVMRHLLTVQGLDPDSVPGEKDRLAMLEALDAFFEAKHEKDFDDDYDTSWVQKRFEEARGHLKQLNLTKDKFMELTDLSRLPNLGRVNDVSEEPIDELVQKVNPVAPETKKQELPLFDPGDAIQQLKDFMNDLGKKLEETKPTENKPAGIKTGKKKLNKGKRPGSGAKVRRVIDAPPPPDYVEKKSAIKEAVKAKLDRCKKLVDDMVERSLCENTTTAIDEQLQQLLMMNDTSLDSLERVVSRHVKSPSHKFTGSFRRVQK